MLDFVHRQIESIATWPVVSLLVVLLVLCTLGLDWRQEALGRENRILDGRFWYTPVAASELFEALGARGRRLYALTAVTLDVLFPLVYGALFAALIVHLYPLHYARLLVALPVLAAVFDILENGTIAYLAWQFDDGPCSLAWAAAVFTASKFVAFVLALGVVLVGALRGVMGS